MLQIINSSITVLSKERKYAEIKEIGTLRRSAVYMPLKLANWNEDGKTWIPDKKFIGDIKWIWFRIEKSISSVPNCVALKIIQEHKIRNVVKFLKVSVKKIFFTVF